MGGSSSPQNASSGLSSLFLGNQPTQTGQSGALAPITAPQSLIGQLDLSQLPSKPAPQAPAPQPTHRSNFTPDPHNPGYGWMMVEPSFSAYYGGDTGQPRPQREYVSAPAPSPTLQPAPYQTSQSSQIAALINSQFGKK